ncbi:MAG: uroporphyrinogen decarboxylase family protein [Clostridia bacterium]|nr:uroporphyrinogen decarboxylase family protein [Clostridia bacterium]
MTPKERFIKALNREPLSGRVPTFELVFYLTMEKFGRLHPSHRNFNQWDQMSDAERDLHRNDIADLYVTVADEYDHGAIFPRVAINDDFDELLRGLDLIRKKSGEKYFLMRHGDATFSIPNGNEMLEFSYRMVDDPKGLKKEAGDMVDSALKYAEKLEKYKLLDGFALCADYCLNTGPFMSPGQFSEFVAPYLEKLINGYKEMGYYVIKHTDGNIMPIIDQLVQCKPHALHSLDPQAGVDIAEVKKLYGDKICLIGNVNCGLLETGTDEDVAASVRYALENGMPGYGYIFSTSNCVYTGMPLERYELMMEIWRKEGVYPGPPI